ncbi:MAG: SNF2-related protein, partial [Euryarchaeota archaeon]|nr:SNF2-related protein [Euryarchaeota archaeon]
STYALAHRDEDTLSAVHWQHVVLDEAQNIKNPAAKQTQAIKKFVAEHRIALTGTPVENRLSELWSIMDFLNPGYLKSAKHFRTNFALPIERYRRNERAKSIIGAGEAWVTELSTDQLKEVFSLSQDSVEPME